MDLCERAVLLVMHPGRLNRRLCRVPGGIVPRESERLVQIRYPKKNRALKDQAQVVKADGM